MTPLALFALLWIAQEPPNPPAQESEATRALRADLQEIKDTGTELQEYWNKVRRKQLTHTTATDPKDREKLKAELAAMIKEGEKMRADLRAEAEKVAGDAAEKIKASPDDIGLCRIVIEAFQITNRTAEIVPLLEKIVKITGAKEDRKRLIQQYYVLNRYTQARERAEKLLEDDPKNMAALELAGMAAFALHDWEGARKHLGAVINSRDASFYNGYAKLYIVLWKAEVELRAREKEKDDLPRAKVTTSRGDIVVELFENEAPNTVANFISLIEKKYYDGLKFHRVIPNFMAQTGCPKGDGSGGPGYRIKDELGKGFRNHFRGSLSMAKTTMPNSGGSQFFINIMPTPHLNGKHTVFGRVIEGQEVVDAIRAEDKIEKIEILRKRDHEYKLETVPE